jgi:DNA-binding NarL/FixJ family response regulator
MDDAKGLAMVQYAAYACSDRVSHVPTQGDNSMTAALAAKDRECALTRREQTVLDMVARGMRNREISQRLEITERTVKFHVSSLFVKLGAGNRTEAVRRALDRGLLNI